MPKNPSPNQSNASRANGSLSKGPTSETGKAKAAHNSTKLGLTAKAIVLPHESQADFDHLHNQYLKELRPQTTVEHDLIEEIAIAKWRLNRVRAAQTKIMGSKDLADIVLDEKLGAALTTLHRYDSQYRRQFDRALRLLTQLREAAAKEAERHTEPAPREIIVRWVDSDSDPDPSPQNPPQNEPDHTPPHGKERLCR